MPKVKHVGEGHDGPYLGSHPAGTLMPTIFGPAGLAAVLKTDELEMQTVVVKRLSSRTGWDGPPGGCRRSSAVSGARASRRGRLRLDKFEPHPVSSLTFTDGVGFEPTRADAHTISSRAP